MYIWTLKLLKLEVQVFWIDLPPRICPKDKQNKKKANSLFLWDAKEYSWPFISADICTVQVVKRWSSYSFLLSVFLKIYVLFK